MCKFPKFHWEIWIFSLYIILSSLMQLSECSCLDKTSAVIVYLNTKWKMNCHHDFWILMVGLQPLSLVKSPLYSLCLRKKTVLEARNHWTHWKHCMANVQFTPLAQTLLHGITKSRKWPLLSFEGQSRTRGWEPQGRVIVDAGNMERESELPDSDPNFSY